MNGFPRRCDIWLVSLEPVEGHEIGKTRPALIISNDKNNQYSSTLTVLPLTTSVNKIYPFEALIKKEGSGLAYDSKVKCNQIRTIDKRRLIKNAGQILPSDMKKVEEALLIHLDISPDGLNP